MWYQPLQIRLEKHTQNRVSFILQFLPMWSGQKVTTVTLKGEILSRKCSDGMHFKDAGYTAFPLAGCLHMYMRSLYFGVTEKKDASSHEGKKGDMDTQLWSHTKFLPI